MLKTKDIEDKFAKFYLEKNHNDCDNAIAEIRSLGIKLLYFSNTGSVCITVKRPGLLIGKRGENIEKLQKYLGCEVIIKEFDGCDIEDQLINLVHQNDPNSWDDVLDHTL
jgi:ribosomal protein S3